MVNIGDENSTDNKTSYKAEFDEPGTLIVVNPVPLIQNLVEREGLL